MDANFASELWNTSKLFYAYSKQGGAASTMAFEPGTPILTVVTGFVTASQVVRPPLSL